MRFAQSLIFTFIIFFSSSVFSEGNKIRLALNWKPEPQFGGFYAAENSQIFKKASLDVEIMPGGMGAPVSQLVASGKAEFGIVTGDEVIVGRARGLPLVALFASYQTFPQGIMVHESHPAKSLAEVFSNPGQIALQKGVPFVLHLENRFGKYAKAKIVPYSGGIASFAKDKNFSQQCFVTSEPIAAKNAGLKVRTFLISESGYNPYTTVVITTLDRIKKDPKGVRQFVSALKDGWSEYLKNPEPTNRYMNSLNQGLSLETFAESAKAQEALILNEETKKSGLGKMTAKRWEELANLLVQVGVIKQKEKLPAQEYYWQ